MYILDTHTLLWLFDEDENLSSSAKNIILTEDTLYVSIVTFWEIAIKQNIEKLKLEKIHNDPFDRLIIAQAQCEDMTIITKDSIIPKYKVKILW
ncbi:type II toxin-antitoxin system VapC family toxin [Treponema putidum]|uniref:type II toxin-antitoxin system VapC family toxin n=1 Tax=Treponema putidum TaxID=221027 RepID=UPI0004F84CF5|nr:type II toxin-antitoxin system VapC family toxin [Treponema putidum]AIN94209.1 twitching motility protein PilT [Treponema putidum]TWI79676.1 PIN domain nuclease of toxin-antitoxin system [Treponema putidum]